MTDEELYQKWKAQYADAMECMAAKKEKKGCLIEVAAQHPLVEGERPNEEFSKRLLLAARIYQEKTGLGEEVRIYVPGSIHMDQGISDRISLSEAGKNYLIQNGIPKEHIFADEMNAKYKGEQGVYNSADECFVAGRIFEEMEAGELHCVCSSAQMMRKALCYIQFGYVPYFHTVSCDRMYHNYIDELFGAIPIVLRDGQGLQGESEEADRLRALRKPKTEEE